MVAGAGTFDKGATVILPAERLARLRRLAKLARLMDTAIGIPGTRLRLGADSVLGLIPVVGDAAGALVGLALVNEARRLGLPRHKLVKMMSNIGIDAAFGSVPLVGDVFDVFFKSHRRNLAVVLDHFGMTNRDLETVRR